MKRTELCSGWEICCLDTLEQETPQTLSLPDRPKVPGVWYTCPSFPMQVQDVLLNAGVIENTGIYGDCTSYQWVAEKDWVYRVSFQATPQGKTFLQFGGLDTIAEIYLNGAQVARHADMFLPLEVDVTDHLQQDNVLVICVRSPYKYLEIGRAHV